MEDLFESDIFVLAIETSTKNGSLAILRNEEVIGGYRFSDGEVASEFLLAGVSRMLSESEVRLSDIGLIAVSEGPGSLTGIRVGLSAGKGLSHGLGVRCIGVRILESLASSVNDAETVCCLIDNGNGKYIWNLIRDGEAAETVAGNISEFFADMAAEKVDKIICDQNAAEKISTLVKSPQVVQNPAVQIGIRALGILKGSEKFDTPGVFEN